MTFLAMESVFSALNFAFIMKSIDKVSLEVNSWPLSGRWRVIRFNCSITSRTSFFSPPLSKFASNLLRLARESSLENTKTPPWFSTEIDDKEFWIIYRIRRHVSISKKSIKKAWIGTNKPLVL